MPHQFRHSNTFLYSLIQSCCVYGFPVWQEHSGVFRKLYWWN